MKLFSTQFILTPAANHTLLTLNIENFATESIRKHLNFSEDDIKRHKRKSEKPFK